MMAGMGAGISFKGMEKFLAGPNKMLLKHVQETYLTGFSYTSKKHHVSADEWVVQQAMNLIPLGSFVKEKENTDTDIEDRATYEMILKRQAEDENSVDENGKLIGEPQEEPVVQAAASNIDLSLEKLMNYEYLVGNFYTIDSTTMTSPEELNAEVLLSKDLKINKETKGPKVLIYHTHSQEGFVDSVPGDTSTTIVGVGDYLTELLNEKGIETIHHEGVYDLIDGELDRSRAYDLAEPEVRKILEDNPSIEVLIDLHRDGVAEGTHLVTEVNGKPTAQIMFFNGLSRTKANGEIDYLYNPYIQDNLAFSLQMQLKAMELYPGFTRHIYLRGYCYNMNIMPKTLLIEAGAQTNTVEEMKNAMEVLAETLDNVLTP
ncbi:MAG: stage II sporulation protein P [Dorea sp.]|nr:stage II sporulation protein P [Dorea sp.]